MLLSAGISVTSDEQRVVARPWPGGEKRSSGRASHHEEGEALASFLPWGATGVALLTVWGLSGATPRGATGDSCRDLPPGRNGLNAWRMAVSSTFREPSLGRHVHRELLRSAVLDLTRIIPATTCHQRN